ncbi:MAG: hypothetical protein NUV77_05510 [Thermoguttaceae bacterium]|jgi:hypothetical protein|nr:hypothetical protein [Thermoguttaceae bacterium]
MGKLVETICSPKVGAFVLAVIVFLALAFTQHPGGKTWVPGRT